MLPLSFHRVQIPLTTKYDIEASSTRRKGAWPAAFAAATPAFDESSALNNDTTEASTAGELALRFSIGIRGGSHTNS